MSEKNKIDKVTAARLKERLEKGFAAAAKAVKHRLEAGRVTPESLHRPFCL